MNPNENSIPEESLRTDDGNAEGAPEELSSGEFEAALDQAIDQEAANKASAVPPTTDQRLHEAEQEALRARAELENFRKRMLRDSEQQLKYSSIGLMRDLLDVVDNLNRATEAAKEDAANTSALLEGVEMVTTQLSGVLAKHACTPIEALGNEFDPNYHEAISQMPSEEYESGIVAQEVAVGYKLHDRVVRPSSVIVSTGSGA